MLQIHPTAIVSPDAVLADDVQIGAYAILEGGVTLGRGCVVRPGAQLLGPITLGNDNDIGRGCILGERPQHKAYAGEATGVVIGHANVFREHVTIHRGMPNAKVNTLVGSHNFLMANSHIAHDCTVGDHCIFANGAVIAGHVTVEDRVFLSGNSAVHQNCRIGRLALLSGTSAVSQDVPPFWVMQGINHVGGINSVGMKRSGMPLAELQAVRQAFKTIYHERRTVRDAAAQMALRFPDSAAVGEIIEFIRTSRRGVPGSHQYLLEGSDLAAA